MGLENQNAISLAIIEFKNSLENSQHNSSIDYEELTKNIVKNLVAVNGDINSQGNNGQTLLHVAATNLNGPCFKHLLELNADPSVRDIGGNTPIQVAMKEVEERFDTDNDAANEKIVQTMIYDCAIISGQTLPDLAPHLEYTYFNDVAPHQE